MNPEFAFFLLGVFLTTFVVWFVELFRLPKSKTTSPGMVTATYYDGSTKDFTAAAWKTECDRQRKVREDLKDRTPFLAAYDPRHQFGGDTIDRSLVAGLDKSSGRTASGGFISTPLPVENCVVDYDKLKKMLEADGFKTPGALIKPVTKLGTCIIDYRPHVKYPNCMDWTPVEIK
jgi:hypothetical protein